MLRELIDVSSQEKFAQMTGLTYSVVHFLEVGRAKMDPVVARRISDATGVDAYSLDSEPINFKCRGSDVPYSKAVFDVWSDLLEDRTGGLLQFDIPTEKLEKVLGGAVAVVKEHRRLFRFLLEIEAMFELELKDPVLRKGLESAFAAVDLNPRRLVASLCPVSFSPNHVTIRHGVHGAMASVIGLRSTEAVGCEKERDAKAKKNQKKGRRRNLSGSKD